MTFANEFVLTQHKLMKETSSEVTVVKNCETKQNSTLSYSLALNILLLLAYGYEK